jgi:thiol-disulfide isomerase/thioredoxin
MPVPALPSEPAPQRPVTRAALQLLVLFSLLSSANTSAEPSTDSKPLPPYQQLMALNQQPSSNSGPALLLLFAPDCRFCKQQARLMAQLQAQCPSVRLALLGVNASRADLLQEVRQLKTPLPAYLANPTFLRAIDGVQAVPTSLVLDADGRMLLKHRGMLDASQLTQLNQALLAPGCQPRLQ